MLNAEESRAVSILVRSMIPIEILSFVIVALMYGTIAMRDYVGKKSDRTDIKLELSMLFVLGGLAHLLITLWFIVFYYLSGTLESDGIGQFDLRTFFDTTPAYQSVANNIVFHILASVAYWAALLIWRFISINLIYKYLQPALDWFGVFIFSSIILTVYNVRLGQYLDTMHR